MINGTVCWIRGKKTVTLFHFSGDMGAIMASRMTPVDDYFPNGNQYRPALRSIVRADFE